MSAQFASSLQASGSRQDVMVVLGTRPEIIKLGPLINLLGDRTLLVHTGQHYDVQMSEVFFEAFKLRPPDFVLGIGGGSRGTQIGNALTDLTDLVGSRGAQAVIVQGDTNSAVAGALAANATGVTAVHVESGLRSYDRRMPEEHNRVITDHLCDILCAPTETSVENLMREAIPPSRIALTGNTIVEAVQLLLPASNDRRELLKAFELQAGEFVVATIHRPENVDDPERLTAILHSLAELGRTVVLPIHPRTERRVAEFELGGLLDRLQTIRPLGYKDFLAMISECAFLVSDSGGIQEEASIVKRPVIVVRHSTERPEVQETFARMSAPETIGETASSWLDDIEEVHLELRRRNTPYGDGQASERILGELHGLIE